MYTGSISAKRLGAVFNAAALPMVYGIDADDAGDKLDATVGADMGYGDTDVGIRQGNFTFRCLIDVAGGVTPLQPRDQLTDFEYFYDTVLSPLPAISAAKCIVLSARRTGEVRGRWEYTVTIDTRGQYTVNS